MPEDISAQSNAITSDERIRNVLRRLIQRAYDTRDFTRETLAASARINKYQLDAIVSRDTAKQRRVAAEDAFCIAYALGEDAVNALLAEIAYGGATHLDGSSDFDASQLIATLLPDVTTLAKAAADGRIDHIERPFCRDAADHIIATVLPLSSAGALA